MEYLVIGWTFILAFCVIMYVILDGFTLGTGLLLPFVKDEKQRDIMFSAVLPTWDGNQTWLVLGGAALYGAFPLAFSVILPALYLPLILMVAALLFRGIVFEFRLKAERNSVKQWDRLFFIASLCATVIQGAVLGAFVTGFPDGISHINIPQDRWLSGFSIFTGVSLIFGYALLGSTRLVLKTTGELQQRMFFFAKIALVLVAFFMGIVTIWTPFVDPHITARWFTSGRTAELSILPIVTVIAFLWCAIALCHERDIAPYWASVVMFLCAYVGFGYSTWPYIVPHSITIWQAASNEHSLAFTMVGACIMLPVLLLYTGYSYRIFRGKIDETIHY